MTVNQYRECFEDLDWRLIREKVSTKGEHCLGPMVELQALAEGSTISGSLLTRARWHWGAKARVKKALRQVAASQGLGLVVKDDWCYVTTRGMNASSQRERGA